MVENHGIELRGVRYQVGDFALDELSLQVRNGEYFVLTGPNGTGKTITIKLIAGLLQPTAGAILIHGRPVTDLPPWKRNIGYVPQDGLLFPNRTVRENIRFGLEVRRVDRRTIRTEIDQVASIMNIGRLLDRMPAGLSGGERQKVSLARALVYKPAVLLLDEPTSAIDEDARDDLCRELHRIQRETRLTTLHISHNRKETNLVADRIGVIIDGRLKDVMEAANRNNGDGSDADQRAVT